MASYPSGFPISVEKNVTLASQKRVLKSVYIADNGDIEVVNVENVN